jgi:hypothetical protein
MFGRALFLASIQRGLMSYPKPGFWSVLYLLYLLGAEMLWSLMNGVWQGPLIQVVLHGAVSYGCFRAMKEFDDGVSYWGSLVVGYFLMIAILP